MVRSETSRRAASSLAVTRRRFCISRRIDSRRSARIRTTLSAKHDKRCHELSPTLILMNSLKEQVVLVAGGSRGAGRGIALACGDAGATVYVAARTSKNGPKPADGAPGAVEETAAEVTARGGNGIPVCADLSNEEQVSALFSRIEREHGSLHVLANAAWDLSGNRCHPRAPETTPLEQPLSHSSAGHLVRAAP